MRDCDIAVIGAGAAGLTAAMTAGRFGAAVIILSEMSLGGQIMSAGHIENMPGFPGAPGGHDLAPAMLEQAEAAGAELIFDRVEAVERDGASFIIAGAEEALRARAVIIAAGSSPRKLGIPGEDGFAGKGVSRCASCDGPLYRGKNLCVIGGGDAAFDEALCLSEFAARVTILCRSEAPRAQKVLRERVAAAANIDLRTGIRALSIGGAQTVSSLEIENTKTGARETLEADGAFIYAGQAPNTAFLNGLAALDEAGRIVVDLMMRTSASGVFAAGAVRAESVALLASAAGDGATAGAAAARWLGMGGQAIEIPAAVRGSAG